MVFPLGQKPLKYLQQLLQKIGIDK